MILSKPRSSYRLFSTIITKMHVTKIHGQWANIPKPQVIPEKYNKRFTATNRIVRQEPGEVRLGFIPNEWFEFFFTKTGVSGCGTFCFTFCIFLISKEFYVMEHEYYGGLSMAILCVLATKYVGPLLANALDKGVDDYEQKWNDTKELDKKIAEKMITNENKLQKSSEAQLLLLAAKRENVALQLEAVYRERVMHAYKETKKRLEYCVQREQIEQALARRRMAGWVSEQVKNSITGKIEDSALNNCMEDLQKLAKKLKEVVDSTPPIIKT